MRILIVDDHASFRGFAARALEAAGFVVVGQAATASAALSEAAELMPDGILLDLVLPDGSGLEIAGALMDLPRRPRVVLTSSRGSSDFGSSYRWPPGCEFVPKHELSLARLAGLFGEA